MLRRQIYICKNFTYQDGAVVAVLVCGGVEGPDAAVHHLQGPLLVVQSVEQGAGVLDSVAHPEAVDISRYIYFTVISVSLVHVAPEHGDLDVSLVQVLLAEVLDLVDHGLEPLLVGRAVPELPAREVVEVSEGGHPRLRVSHHHYVARLGSVGPDYCNLEYLSS